MPKQYGWTEQQIDDLQNMVDNGVTVKEMSYQLNKSPHAVYQYIERHKICPSANAIFKSGLTEKKYSINLHAKKRTPKPPKEMPYQDWEICKLYRSAKDKQKQIGILADLNCCTQKKIIKILEANGEKIDETTLKDKVLAMLKANFGTQQIREALNITNAQVYYYRKVMRKEQGANG